MSAQNVGRDETSDRERTASNRRMRMRRRARRRRRRRRRWPRGGARSEKVGPLHFTGGSAPFLFFIMHSGSVGARRPVLARFLVTCGGDLAGSDAARPQSETLGLGGRAARRAPVIGRAAPGLELAADASRPFFFKLPVRRFARNNSRSRRASLRGWAGSASGCSVFGAVLIMG